MTSLSKSQFIDLLKKIAIIAKIARIVKIAIYAVPYFLGSEEDANGFTCVITLRDSKHSLEEHSYKCHVLSTDVKLEQIVNGQRGLVLTDKMVRRILDENDSMEWTIRLHANGLKMMESSKLASSANHRLPRQFARKLAPPPPPPVRVTSLTESVLI